MTTIHKAVTVAGLAATFAFTALAMTPVFAAPPVVVHHQLKHAARLDHKAKVAAKHGHVLKAAHLRAKAAHIRAKAKKGH